MKICAETSSLREKLKKICTIIEIFAIQELPQPNGVFVPLGTNNKQLFYKNLNEFIVNGIIKFPDSLSN